MTIEILLLLLGLIIGFFIGWFLLSMIKWRDKEKALDAKWRIKYVQDIEELKRQFQESEKLIRQKSLDGSRRSLTGKFVEKFIPFLQHVSYEPADMHFLGQPIDYVVFDGLHEDKVSKIVFLEVKTGQSQLTKRERSVRDAIKNKRVEWREIRVDQPAPEKEVSGETVIKKLYDYIDEKIKNAK